MHSPLGFWLILNDYLDGTKSQKRRSLSRLVEAVSKIPSAASMLMDILRPLSEDHISELLLSIAQKLDLEIHKVTWDREDFQNVMINTIRFYSSANQLVKALREKRDPPNLHRPARSAESPDLNGLWSREKIREALIQIYLEKKCSRKAAAESLLTTSADLRLRIFPRFGIIEKALQRRWIEDAVLECPEKIGEAAERLGMSSQTLRKKLKKYGIQRPLPPKKILHKLVDRLPVVQWFEEMHHGTAETTAKDYKFRKYCLLFFGCVDRLFNKEFRTEEEKKYILRSLRQSASRNRRRIHILYDQLFARPIPFDITKATRYKFCKSILYEIFKSRSSDGMFVDILPSGDPKMDEMILSLMVWALRHWTEKPINWKDYRRCVRTGHPVPDVQENPSPLPRLA